MDDLIYSEENIVLKVYLRKVTIGDNIAKTLR